MTMSRPCRSLYVHVPFCRSRCGYCDFYSEVIDPGRVAAVVDALVGELADHAERHELALETIYVGGGTPTVLPVGELERLLGQVRAHAGIAVEFTVEANPATVTDEVAAVLADAGVNRVSMGAQSFVESELRALERTHRPSDVGESVETCRRAGIGRVSLDLIFGIPGQTLGSWLRSIEAALGLRPEHLSCYGLTYEAGTRLQRQLEEGRVQRVDPDVEADLYEAVMDTLPPRGWHQYEISNFARRGAECCHNLVYWHNEPYVGVGPSAAGFIDEERYKNVSDTAAYVEAIREGRSPRAERECLSPERRACETAMLELRLGEGIDRKRFAERYGEDPVVFFSEAINRHGSAGRLEVDEVGIRLTRAGRLLANTVMVDFL